MGDCVGDCVGVAVGCLLGEDDGCLLGDVDGVLVGEEEEVEFAAVMAALPELVLSDMLPSELRLTVSSVLEMATLPELVVFVMLPSELRVTLPSETVGTSIVTFPTVTFVEGLNDGFIEVEGLKVASTGGTEGSNDGCAEVEGLTDATLSSRNFVTTPKEEEGGSQCEITTK